MSRENGKVDGIWGGMDMELVGAERWRKCLQAGPGEAENVDLVCEVLNQGYLELLTQLSMECQHIPPGIRLPSDEDWKLVPKKRYIVVVVLHWGLNTDVY